MDEPLSIATARQLRHALVPVQSFEKLADGSRVINKYFAPVLEFDGTGEVSETGLSICTDVPPGYVARYVPRCITDATGKSVLRRGTLVYVPGSRKKSRAI